MKAYLMRQFISSEALYGELYDHSRKEGERRN